MDSNQGNSSGYAGDGGSGTVITEQVKQTGQQAVQQTQQAVSQAAEGAKSQATSYAEGQKQTASQGLRSVAQALHQTSSNMGDQSQSPVAKYAATAGDKVDQFAQYLESTPVQDLARDVENYARNNSTLFLGGAFMLGLAAARFLKASSRQSNSGSQYYGSSYGYGGALPDSGTYGYGSQYSSSQSYGGGSQSSYGSGGGFAASSPAYEASETVVVDEVEYPDATVFDAEGDTTNGSSL
jgi:hypothetical protein